MPGAPDSGPIHVPYVPLPGSPAQLPPSVPPFVQPPSGSYGVYPGGPFGVTQPGTAVQPPRQDAPWSSVTRIANGHAEPTEEEADEAPGPVTEAEDAPDPDRHPEA
jgi:hypothetical protein